MSRDYAAPAGGMATTRLSGTEEERLRRAQTQAAAARYLLRTGNGDLLPLLGLDRRDLKACEGCGALFEPRNARQKYHSKACYLTNAVVV